MSGYDELTGTTYPVYVITRLESVDGVMVVTHIIVEKKPFAPYRETLHRREDWQDEPYWFRTRSNPFRTNYH